MRSNSRSHVGGRTKHSKVVSRPSCARMHKAEPHATLQDHHSLHIHELPNSPGGELAPVSRRFDAAEGQARVRRYHAVEEHHPGVDLLDEALLLGGIAGPRAGAESERRIV